MSTIQSAASPVDIQYIVGAVGFLVSCISVLIAFIVRGFKKDVDEIKLMIKENKQKQDTDHDRIDRIDERCSIHHNKP